jgi:hypothetical protein
LSSPKPHVEDGFRSRSLSEIDRWAQHSVFLDRNAILIEPEFNAGRLRFLAIEVDAQDYDGDNQAASDQVQGYKVLFCCRRGAILPSCKWKKVGLSGPNFERCESIPAAARIRYSHADSHPQQKTDNADPAQHSRCGARVLSRDL